MRELESGMAWSPRAGTRLSVFRSETRASPRLLSLEVLLLLTARDTERWWHPASLPSQNGDESWMRAWSVCPMPCRPCPHVLLGRTRGWRFVPAGLTPLSTHVLSTWHKALSQPLDSWVDPFVKPWSCDRNTRVVKIPLLSFVTMPISPKQIHGRVIYWNYHGQLHHLELYKFNWNILKRKLGFF